MRVPVSNVPQVAQNTLPGIGIRTPVVDVAAGQQSRDLGQSLTQFGGDVGRVARELAAQANQLRVDDALNKAKEESLRLTYDKTVGFTTVKGEGAFQRESGKPLADEYGETLQKKISEISEGLGNDFQKSAFSQHANDILTQFRSSAVAHEAQEFRTYGLSVTEGITKTAMNDIALNWNNPGSVDSAVERIRAQTYQQGKLLGKSAAWIDAKVQDLTSAGHKTAILTALENNDPSYAEAYMSRKGPDGKTTAERMNADDILAVRGHITREMDAKIGIQAGMNVFKKMPLEVSNSDRMLDTIKMLESGGKQFGADGMPLTSKAGAIGMYQIHPGHSKDKDGDIIKDYKNAKAMANQSGVEFDLYRYENDSEYQKILASGHINVLAKKYGGDIDKMLAGYNLGETKLDLIIEHANIKGIDWRTHPDLPNETKNYVKKGRAYYEKGLGTPKPTLADYNAALQNDQALASSPERMRIAQSQVEHTYKLKIDAEKQRDDAAVSSAFSELINNGGNFNTLPASIKGAIPPQKYATVMDFAKRIAKGDDATDLATYNTLTSNPAQLASMSDDAFLQLRANLSEADFKHFANERAKAMGRVEGGIGDLNSGAIKQGVDYRLEQIGINPSPKADDQDEVSRVGGLRKFVNDYFISAQREAGKKFSDAEVNAHLDTLFAKTSVIDRSGWSDGSGPMLALDKSDIPSEVTEHIRAAFKKAGINSPTDSQIVNAYWNIQIRNQK